MIYEQFKKALFNASPELEKEIKELKPDCKIVILDTDCEYEAIIKITAISPKGGSIYGFGNGFHERKYEAKNLIEIIGRDITLEDVLSSLEGNKELGDYHIGDGYFIMYNFDTENNEILFYWKLGNPAHEQSEETLKSLIKLL